MKFLAFLLVSALSVNAPMASGAGTPSSAGKPAAPVATNSARLDRAAAECPLMTCVVAGEELAGGRGMDEAKDFFCDQAGQPDRLVRLCCGKYEGMFENDSAHDLGLIDEAAAKVTKH